MSKPAMVADQQAGAQLLPVQLAPGKPFLLTMVVAASHS